MSDFLPCKTCGKSPDLVWSEDMVEFTCGNDSCWRNGANLVAFGLKHIEPSEKVVEMLKNRLGHVWNENQSGVDTAAKYGAKKRR